MNRPNGQQCLAKAIVDYTSLWWFNRKAYSSETAVNVTMSCKTQTGGQTDTQYAILHPALFAEPLPDNDWNWCTIFQVTNLAHNVTIMDRTSRCDDLFSWYPFKDWLQVWSAPWSYTTTWNQLLSPIPSLYLLILIISRTPNNFSS